MDAFKQLPTRGDAVNLIGLTACKLHSLPLAPLTWQLDAVRCMCVCEWHPVFVQAFSGKRGTSTPLRAARCPWARCKRCSAAQHRHEAELQAPASRADRLSLRAGPCERARVPPGTYPPGATPARDRQVPNHPREPLDGAVAAARTNLTPAECDAWHAPRR
jgi:hypothetical protein